jgi:hypothetical protein
VTQRYSDAMTAAAVARNRSNWDTNLYVTGVTYMMDLRTYNSKIDSHSLRIFCDNSLNKLISKTKAFKDNSQAKE